MNRLKKFSVVIAFVMLAVMLSLGTASAQPDYTITDLGDLGTHYSIANGVNDSGQVVGWSTNAIWESRAFLWDTFSGMQDLGTLGGSWSEAYGINNFGQVVGASSITGNTENHAFLWDPVNGMQDLGTLGGAWSWAYDINDAGQVVGWSSIANGETRAFLWDPVNGMQDLGTLGGGVWSEARGINNSGQVVGISANANWEYRAFLWDSVSGMQDLGTLGGSWSDAYGINDAGQVVGGSEIANWDYNVFLWDPVSGMQDLGNLPGNGWGYGTGINSSGQVVGQSCINDGPCSPFVWISGTMYNLDKRIPLGSGWTMDGASGINDSGAIAGWGYNSLGTHAILLEPASLNSIEGAIAIDGSPVVGGSLALINKATGATIATTTTDVSGAYRFEPLDFGTYMIRTQRKVISTTSTGSGILQINGFPAAGTLVGIREVNTGAVTTTTTGAGGGFSFPGVVPGTYRFIIPTINISPPVIVE